MIHFMPHMEFTIDSDKTPEELRRIMEAETKIREGWWVQFPFSIPDYNFIGEVEETSFKVEPILPSGIYDNFAPVILGQIWTQADRTEVDIRMRLRWDAFAFCMVWFGMSGLYFAFCVLALITGTPDAWKGIAAGAGMFLFGQLLVRVGFYLPARMARRKLEGLLGNGKG